MPNVDESITRLILDNSQFNGNADVTLDKLDQLKRSLEFKGVADGFGEIEKAAKKTDFSPMETGVQALSKQFDALATIADQTLRNITNRAISAGESMVKGLTVDNISAGWSKYGDKTSAVQTIMASTASKFEDTGVQMEYVEDQLNKLNWFTDETSYAFLDMVNNIGKFTSNNIELDKAATAMQGISNWAAISGAGITGASRAMYNLAQAIGLGAVTLMDWKSIELANMGTVEFKQMAMEVAAADGQLKKLNDDVYQTAKGTKVTIETFRDSLSEKWFTSDVLIDVLNKYGGFADELYKLSEITGLSATPLIRYVNEYKDGTLDLQDAVTATGLSASELTGWLEKLGSDEMDLGRRAFAAAQEAKTFEEAINATKEAVSTGWMNTFEIIFGNYEEAKELWSDLAEGLYDVFVESGNVRNGLLSMWKELGGREYLIDGLRIACSKLVEVLSFIKDTIRNVFPPKTAEELVYMTEGFYKFVDSLKLSETTITNIQNIITPFLTALQKIGQVAFTIFAALEPIWIVLGQLGGAIIALMGNLGKLASMALDKIFSSTNITNLYDAVNAVAKVVAGVLTNSFRTFFGILESGGSFISDIFTTFRENGGGIKGFIDSLISNFKALFDRISSGTSSINNIFSSFFGIFQTIFGGIHSILQKIFGSFDGSESKGIIGFFKSIASIFEETGIFANLKSAGVTVASLFSDIFAAIGDADNVGQLLHKAVSFIVEQIDWLWKWLTSGLKELNIRDIAMFISLTNFAQSINGVASSFSDVGEALTGSLKSFSGFMDRLSGGKNSMKDKINDFVENTKYLQMALAMVVITSSLIKLGQMPIEQVTTGVLGIIAVFGSLLVFMKMLKDIADEDDDKINDMATGFIKISIAVGILSTAVYALGNMDLVSLGAGLVAVAALLAEFLGFAYVVKKIEPSGKELSKLGVSMMVMAVGLTMLTAPVAILGAIDTGKLMQGLISVALLLVSVSGIALMLNDVKVGSLLGAAVAIDLIAVAITALTIPVFAMGQLSLQKIMTGLSAVVVLLTSLTAVSKILGKGANFISIMSAAMAMDLMAAAIVSLTIPVFALAQLNLEQLILGLVGIATTLGLMTAAIKMLETGVNPLSIISAAMAMDLMAVAITAMTIPVLLLGNMDLGSLAKGLTSIALLLVEIVGFMALLKATSASAAQLITVSAGVIVLATGLNMMAAAVGRIGALDIDQLLKGLLSVIALIGVLTTATIALGKLGGGVGGGAVMLAASVAMVAFASAVLILASAIVVLNNAKPEAFAKGIALITAAFVGFAVVAAICSAAAAGVLVLSAALVAGAATFYLVAKGVDVLADGIRKLVDVVSDVIVATEVFGDELPAKIDIAMSHIRKIIAQSVSAIATNSVAIMYASASLFSAIANGIALAVPGIVNALTALILGILRLIASITGPLVDTIIEVIHALTPRIPDLLKVVGEFLEELFAGIGVLLWDGLIGLVRGIFSSFGMQGIGNWIGEKMHALGDNTVEGMIQGMNDRVNDARNKGNEVGSETIAGMAEGAGVASPSYLAEGIAHYIGEGFFNGMDDVIPEMNTSGFSSMTSFFDGMTEGAIQGGNTISNVLDAILQMVGWKTQQIKSQAALAEEARDELLQEKRHSKGLSSKIDETAKTAGISSGQTFADNFAAAVSPKTGGSSKSSAKSTAEKVKTAAEKIIESYEDALKELSYLDKKYKGEYDLWTTLNNQARDAEKTAANLEYVNKQIETQTKRTQIAEEKYQKIAKAMGKASAEARDAEIEWIEEQVSLAKLQNEMVELQNKTIEEAAKQLELEEKNAELTYNLWVSSNKNASQTEQLEKKLEYTLKKLEYSSNKVTEATEAYNKALEEYGEEAIETKTALNELLEVEKDYADLSVEVEEIQKDITDLESQHAETALEGKRILYDIWEMTNKSASKAEKSARQAALLMAEYESTLNVLDKATKDYHEALSKYGEDSIEAANAYKTMLEADKNRLEKYSQLAEQEKEQLTWLTESLSMGLQKAEAEDDLWNALNENASKEEKNARERLSIIRKRVYAEQELFIMEKQYAQLVEEEGANSDNALQAAIEITKKKAEIAGYVTDETKKAEELLDIESKNLDFERKRLQVADEYWSVINENATEVEKTSHEIEKANWEMVLSMKELTFLSEQYNKQVERYGETSDEARSAWESYRDKQKEIIELQNERKALELELIENELSLQSLADTRAKTEYDLWEALNQDADESEKKTKKITYQMSLLESATEKLRVASKKYNYALAAYGEDAKKTQELFNEMLDAQLAYANTYNELKSVQQEIITKNNDILEQLDQSEKLLSYGYNMWESLYDDISDAQKIEAEIKKLGMELTTQVARANYYGAEWKRAVAKYGENSAEAQSAYLDYLDALNEAVSLQSSLEKKEAELTKKRADDAQALQDAWDEIKAKDLVGGTSIYDELVEMGLSDAEIEAYVREKAGVIEDNIDAEMDFSLDKMQSKAEESLREWGMTWMDGVYEVADDVVTTAGSCINEMTSIIDQGAAEGKEHAQTAMSDIDKVVTDGGQTIVISTEQALSDMINTITSNKSEVVNSVKQVINDVATTASAGMTRQFVTIGLAISLGIEQGIYSGRSNVIQAATNVIEDAIWAAKRAGEIHSPSRPMIWIGTMLDAGLIKGIEQRAGEIAKTMASAIQNGINAMHNVVHTSNTLDFVGQMVAGGIQSAVDGYSYNILEVGREVLDSLASEYDEMVDDVIGENQWLIDALRDYGFDETTHGIEFVVNLDADEARTELENLLLGREDALEYYDELLSMQERNAEKDQNDLAVRAEAQAIAREINRILASIQASEDAITAIVEAGRSKSYDDTIAGKKFEYVQNIYSTKPLSPLDIYRNTNSQLLRFTNWR